MVLVFSCVFVGAHWKIYHQVLVFSVRLDWIGFSWTINPHNEFLCGPNDVFTCYKVYKWRKRWDSNSRWAWTHDSFQDCSIKPLCHSSVTDKYFRNYSATTYPKARIIAKIYSLATNNSLNSLGQSLSKAFY